MLLVVIIHFLNVNNDNVQTLENFSIGIANSHSWSIIMPSLSLNPSCFFRTQILWWREGSFSTPTPRGAPNQIKSQRLTDLNSNYASEVTDLLSCRSTYHKTELILNLSTVGIRIPDIRIMEPFDYRTFTSP